MPINWPLLHGYWAALKKWAEVTLLGRYVQPKTLAQHLRDLKP